MARPERWLKELLRILPTKNNNFSYISSMVYEQQPPYMMSNEIDYVADGRIINPVIIDKQIRRASNL